MMIHQLESRFLTIAFCEAPKTEIQDAVRPLCPCIIDLHHDIFFFLILIWFFVLLLLVRALWHSHENTNPIPQRIVHGTTIEIIWTIFPSIILMFIAIPTFALLYSMDEVVVDPAVTIKAMGHRWYWTYEYSDYNSSDELNRAFLPIVGEGASLKGYGDGVSHLGLTLWAGREDLSAGEGSSRGLQLDLNRSVDPEITLNYPYRRSVGELTRLINNLKPIVKEGLFPNYDRRLPIKENPTIKGAIADFLKQRDASTLKPDSAALVALGRHSPLFKEFLGYLQQKQDRGN